jgi:hypothetical protein
MKLQNYRSVSDFLHIMGFKKQGIINYEGKIDNYRVTIGSLY